MLFFAIFATVLFVYLLINSNKVIKGEIKDGVHSKIIKVEDATRGDEIFYLEDGTKFYTAAFGDMSKRYMTGDSIYKEENSKVYFYYKFDSIKMVYYLFEKGEIYTGR